MWTLRNLTGRVLKVDLTTQETVMFDEDPEVHRTFLGGRGLNQFFLYNHLDSEKSPLDPEISLCFGAGLLSGTRVPAATRLSIDAKNNFSEGVGSTSAAGGVAPSLKRAGIGMIIVEGRAERPVYLSIENGSVRIEPSSEFWGKTTAETVDGLKKRMGKDIHVACIGPAGENRVRGASVMVDKGRAAAKCGMGAIMGSKNLKAIAVRGTQPVRVANSDEFEALCREAWSKVSQSMSAKTLSTWGTKLSAKGKNAVGAIAFRHFQDGFTKSLEGFDENAFAPYEQKRFSCPGCPISCRQLFRIDTGPYAGVEGESIQANSIQDFGAKLDIRYTPAIIKAHLLCNEYGMDIDTVAESIAWAFECFEKGILTERDTKGLQLGWGNHEVLITLIQQIAYRQGFGDILAEGVKRASEIIGRGSQSLAVSMKGQDLYEDMRMPKGYVLGAALSTRGGGHCSGSPMVEFSSKEYDAAGYEGKANLVASTERFHAVLNSLGICFFVTTWEGPD
jgi:aldehyde:ferredoxin oxidoreductase